MIRITAEVMSFGMGSFVELMPVGKGSFSELCWHGFGLVSVGTGSG